MKKFLDQTRQKMRQYWRQAMHSSKLKLSRGVEHINRLLAYGRGNNNKRRNKK